MSSPMSGGLARRLVLILAATALMVGLGASTALASVGLSPGGPYGEEAEVVVSGSAPTGTTHVAIATCNVATGVVPGTRCDGERATGLEPVAVYSGGIELTLLRGPWIDWDFTSGVPAELETTTTCKNVGEEGDQCAVVVSYYKVEGKAVTQLGAEAASVLFE